MKFFLLTILTTEYFSFFKQARHPLPKVLLHFGDLFFYDVNSNY